MNDQVKITYYGLYKEANRLLDKSKISLGDDAPTILEAK